jgi:hypothetical protein
MLGRCFSSLRIPGQDGVANVNIFDPPFTSRRGNFRACRETEDAVPQCLSAKSQSFEVPTDTDGDDPKELSEKSVRYSVLTCVVALCGDDNLRFATPALSCCRFHGHLV